MPIASEIALSLIAAGGKLVSGVMPEKEQFFAVLKEFLQRVRNEDERTALATSRQWNP